MTRKHIDVHVHCRDWNLAYKATIKSVTETARAQGVVAIADMPNTNPPITTKELVEKRLETAKEEGCLDGYYLFMGATKDPEQLAEAVDTIKSNPKVLGFKFQTGKSVGTLEVSTEESQRSVYKTLADLNYKGVIMLHCEKESMYNDKLFDPSRPYTWNLARPMQVEIESVKDQIRLAKESGIEAHLHVCHISAPESVELVNEARSDINITCGITPHHITLSSIDLQTPESVVYKVNPPIRDHEPTLRLRSMLKAGMIDWIETDHAPHSKEEKRFDPKKPANSYMSGIPSLNIYSTFIEELVDKYGFTAEQIDSLTYSNIKKAFPKIIE